jgi:hypothetical protein
VTPAGTVKTSEPTLRYAQISSADPESVPVEPHARRGSLGGVALAVGRATVIVGAGGIRPVDVVDPLEQASSAAHEIITTAPRSERLMTSGRRRTPS